MSSNEEDSAAAAQQQQQQQEQQFAQALAAQAMFEQQQQGAAAAAAMLAQQQQQQQQQQVHQNPMLAQFWANQIQQIEEGQFDFKSHQLPLARIKKVMKTDEDVRSKMVCFETAYTGDKCRSVQKSQSCLLRLVKYLCWS